MKYKKYIFFLLLIMILGCNKIYAAECYYSSSDNKVLLSYDTDKEKFTIEKRGSIEVASVGTKEPLINNGKDKKDSKTGLTINAVSSGCPNYIVYRHNSKFLGSDGVFGFSNYSEAQQFQSASGDINKMSAWILNTTTQANFQTSLQAKNDTDVSCDGIFGSKNDPDSLRYLFNEILQYPRIIVPILVILFGIMDFAKAVIASKEDEMKKAQSTFVKRVIIGVAFFFIPILMNIIMFLADLVWNGMYPTCGL